MGLSIYNSLYSRVTGQSGIIYEIERRANPFEFDADDLPDDLHPNPQGYIRMGDDSRRLHHLFYCRNY